MVEAYILIQTEVGKAAKVAHEIANVDGVTASEVSPGRTTPSFTSVQLMSTRWGSWSWTASRPLAA